MSPLCLAALLQAAGAGAPFQLELQPQTPAPGGLLVITVAGARDGDRVEGEFDGQPLAFFLDDSGRMRSLAAIRTGRKAGAAALVVKVTPPGADTYAIGQPVVIQPREFEKQELSVDERYLRPPRSQRARIRAEQKAMAKLWRAKPTERKWRGKFIWPLQGEIASAFGLKRIFNGRLRSRHWGLDIDGATGAPVKAIGNGTVVMVADRYYSGKTVVIDHGMKLFSMYFHFSEISVSEGQAVAQGDEIGAVGQTGRATGPHLHISVKLDNIIFDPVTLLEADLAE